MPPNKKELELLEQLSTLKRIRLLEERVIYLELTLLEVLNNLKQFKCNLVMKWKRKNKKSPNWN